MKKIIIDSVSWVATTGTLIASGLWLVLFFSAMPGIWNFIFNADALFLPSLWRHLVENHESWTSWYPSVVGFYFPDIITFFIAQMFTIRADYAAYIFFLIQLLQLGVAFALFAPKLRPHGLTPAVTAIAPAMIPLLILLHFAIINLNGGSNAESALVFGPLIASVHHTGTIVSTLLSFYLFMRFGREPKTIWVTAWALLGVIAVASDKLFIVTALAPVIVYGAVRTFRKQTSFRAFSKLIFLCAIIMVLGHQLWVLIGWWHRPAGVDGKLALPSEMLSSLLTFARDLEIFIRTEWWCISGPAAVGFVLLSLDLVRWFRQREPGPSESAAVLLLLGAVMPLLAAIAKGLYNGLTSFRYVEALVIFPLFWTWNRCCQRLSSSAALMVIMLTLITSIVGAGATWARHGKEISDGYYPPLVSCLDDALKSGDRSVRYGYADYWNTKPIRIFSRNGLKVAQLHPEGIDDHWISSDRWSAEVDEAIISGEEFFIVTTRINDAALSARFGLPQRKLICAGERVNIYSSSQK